MVKLERLLSEQSATDRWPTRDISSAFFLCVCVCYIQRKKNCCLAYYVFVCCFVEVATANALTTTRRRRWKRRSIRINAQRTHSIKFVRRRRMIAKRTKWSISYAWKWVLFYFFLYIFKLRWAWTIDEPQRKHRVSPRHICHWFDVSMQDICVSA